MITQSINISYNGTSSVVFNRPVQQITLLDSTNFQFLRQVMLSNDGVKVIKGNYTIQFPMSQLFAAAFQAFPSMSWAPIQSTNPTESQIVFPDTISRATASMTSTATDEFGNDMRYTWFESSSFTSGNWSPVTSSSEVVYQNSGSTTMSASFHNTGGLVIPSYFYYYCRTSNPAGYCTSSVATVFLAP